jgi:hypothetical protein
MQKAWKMFLRHNHHMQSGCRLLLRMYHNPALLPQRHSNSTSPCLNSIIRMNSSTPSLLCQTEEAVSSPPSPPAEGEKTKEGQGGAQRQFYIEREDKLLAATMTPELEQAVLAGIPNGEFALKNLLTELQHLQSKKPYPFPLPEYLTVGRWFPVLLFINTSVADPGSGAFLTPGSGMGKKSRSGIRDEHTGSYF